MPRHFNGIVNRFSAGSRSALSRDGQAAAASFLQRSRVSVLGAKQFLDGEIVANPADRRTLAGIVGGLLNLKQGQPVSQVALLLPAVQAAREAARSTQKLRELGISAAGAHQFVSGLAVANNGDRQVLGHLVIAASRGPVAGHSGGINELRLDDTAGHERK
jgi:hypothetical protein